MLLTEDFVPGYRDTAFQAVTRCRGLPHSNVQQIKRLVVLTGQQYPVSHPVGGNPPTFRGRLSTFCGRIFRRYQCFRVFRGRLSRRYPCFCVCCGSTAAILSRRHKKSQQAGTSLSLGKVCKIGVRSLRCPQAFPGCAAMGIFRVRLA